MNNTAKILIGVTAGIAVGAVIGILYAPAKGAETRENLAKKGKDFANDIAKKFSNEVCKETEEPLN